MSNLYNGAGGTAAGRGAVLFRLAEDNPVGNPVNNRAFIDAEYNRAFVATQYFGYLRRDADLPGLNFWLGVVNQSPRGNTSNGSAVSSRAPTRAIAPKSRSVSKYQLSGTSSRHGTFAPVARR